MNNKLKFWTYPAILGEYLKINWLIYNPVVFLEFAVAARRNAPLFLSACIEEFPEMQTFNDIGCGTGHFTRWLKSAGKKTTAYEYSALGRVIARLIGVKAQKFDVTQTPPVTRLVKADVALTLEVGEHIPAALSAAFVQLLIQAGSVVIFTAARPGQPGYGHINCQPAEFWADIFLLNGYAKWRQKEQSLIQRLKTREGISDYLCENLQIFHRP